MARPALSSALLAAILSGGPAPTVRLVLLAAQDVTAAAKVEVVTTKLLQQAMEHLPHVKFFNTYSISECGEVCATALDGVREDCPKFCPARAAQFTLALEVSRVPSRGEVGHVAAFAQHKLMDESGAEVARGTQGELWIAGRGVGRGYTGHAAPEKQKYV